MGVAICRIGKAFGSESTDAERDERREEGWSEEDSWVSLPHVLSVLANLSETEQRRRLGFRHQEQAVFALLGLRGAADDLDANTRQMR